MFVQFLNGLVNGGLLYIVAVGLVLLFGLRRIVNFAHGGLFMLGGYIGYTAASMGNFWLAVGVVVVVMGALGALLDKAMFRPLQHLDPLITVLVTFGLLLILEDLAQTVWGKGFRALSPPAALAGSIEIGGDTFPTYRLAIIALAAVVAIVLSTVLRHTRIGLYIRASSADSVTTAVQGVDTNLVSAFVVAVGSALAGLSGLVAAPLLSLSPSMGGYVLVESFIVVVIGGVGSFSGALVAALLIGQLHNFGAVLAPWAATMLPFLLMIGVLVWRPNGLTGQRA